ncbi:MAG: hypothetical protein U1F22_08425 [Lysobacterales bacterium]
MIDLAGRRLWRGGGERPLEPKAFAMLALAVAAPARAFARDAILAGDWGHVTPGVRNRVVARLRQPPGADLQAPRGLHAVHGVGERSAGPQANWWRRCSPRPPGCRPGRTGAGVSDAVADSAWALAAGRGRDPCDRTACICASAPVGP